MSGPCHTLASCLKQFRLDSSFLVKNLNGKLHINYCKLAGNLHIYESDTIGCITRLPVCDFFKTYHYLHYLHPPLPFKGIFVLIGTCLELYLSNFTKSLFFTTSISKHLKKYILRKCNLLVLI